LLFSVFGFQFSVYGFRFSSFELKTENRKPKTENLGGVSRRKDLRRRPFVGNQNIDALCPQRSQHRCHFILPASDCDDGCDLL
jgi:hypothetical protein